MKKVKKDVSASEAIYGFMGWLTTRKEVVTLSKSHDCSEAMRLVVEFCRVQGFEKPREGIFPDNLVPMTKGSVKNLLSKEEIKKRRIKASDLFQKHMCNYCWGNDDGGEGIFGLFHLISWFIIIGFVVICFSWA